MNVNPNRCPHCQREQPTKVTDSRPGNYGMWRRGRECLVCGTLFTSYEIFQEYLNQISKETTSLKRLLPRVGYSHPQKLVPMKRKAA